MIFRQAILSAASSAALVAGLLGGGAPEPSRLLAIERAVAERSATAVRRLDALAAPLESALDELRAGAALLVQGEGRPSERIGTAADRVGGAAPAADAASEAVVALEGALGVALRETVALERPPGPAELRDAEGSLRALAEAADAFYAMRARTTALLERVGDALAAIDGGRHEAARDAVAAARAEHARIGTWEIGSAALGAWLETTGGMIAAVERLNEATELGDDSAVTAARDQLDGMSAEAGRADRALSVAIAEGAASLAAPAVERLAGLLETVERARASVVDVRATP